MWAVIFSAPLFGEDDSGASTTGSVNSATSVVTDFDALEVLNGVRDRLEALQYLQCNLYEYVHLSELRFYARGQYAQAGNNRVRVEFKIFPIRGVRQTDKATLELGGEPEDTGKQQPTGELTQVSDGNSLWTYWKNGDVTRLTRRDIQEILKVASESEKFDADHMLADLGTGGLQSLIARLQLGMEFGKVREQSLDGSRLLVISGRWTAESLKKYFNVEDRTATRPNWMPEYVRVYVDADAMLPRRIQYLKRHPNPEEKRVRPLITLDFRAMTITDTVDESQFHFEAPEGELELDETSRTIEMIQQAASQSAEAIPTVSDSISNQVEDINAGESAK
ncbi:MAG: hypothetical protein MK102_00180 [Fuerstiella sp.]|nr:hypothetical protein [Fuerstiella sp.]